MHNSNATKVSLDRNPTDPPRICYGYTSLTSSKTLQQCPLMTYTQTASYSLNAIMLVLFLQAKRLISDETLSASAFTRFSL